MFSRKIPVTLQLWSKDHQSITLCRTAPAPGKVNHSLKPTPQSEYLAFVQCFVDYKTVLWTFSPLIVRICICSGHYYYYFVFKETKDLTYFFWLISHHISLISAPQPLQAPSGLPHTSYFQQTEILWIQVPLLAALLSPCLKCSSFLAKHLFLEYLFNLFRLSLNHGKFSLTL